MKHVFALMLGIGTVFSAIGQQPMILPNTTNQFIASSHINWASNNHSYVSFVQTRLVKGTNIYDYLLQKATAGKLKVGKESWETVGLYTQMAAKPQPALSSEAKDEEKRLLLHEIFYLEQYQLKSTVIAAAPLANVFTSTGVNLGQNVCFFCCGENKKRWAAKGWILLQSVNRRINPDSIGENTQLLKQGFGMSLSQALWYGATQNKSTLTDIVTQQQVAAKDVLNYSVGPKVSVPVYDSTGSITTYKGLSAPAFPNTLENYIDITQDIYFNPTQNIFHTEIRECFLFVRNKYDNDAVAEKRFKLTFRKER